MAGTREASTVLSDEGNEGEKEANKRIKCEEEDDFISDLPDCLIQHILSFLPSTNDAIMTGILSKRWLHQWTWVPLLIFECKYCMYPDEFSDFIDNALSLFTRPKIRKFVIKLEDYFLDHFHDKLGKWIDFAKSRCVKELILDCSNAVEFSDFDYIEYQCFLPEVIFNYPSLVKLKMYCCILTDELGTVNWASLKALYISFSFLPEQSIENVLSGSPLIEYLEVRNCYFCEFEMVLDIASKSLKTFKILNFKCNTIEISCPKLDKLELMGKISVTCLKLKDLPASVCATLDFENDEDWNSDVDDRSNWVREFLLQVKHVKELKLGSWFLMYLSVSLARGESSLLLNSKSLTVIHPYSELRQPVLSIAHLRFSLLEKLVIQLHTEFESSMEIAKNVLSSHHNVFDTFVSHLKTIEIVGLHYCFSKGRHNIVLKFVEFLLKKTRMLEKVVLLEAPGQGMVFASGVCKILSRVKKASPHASVKVAKSDDSESDWDKIDC